MRSRFLSGVLAVMAVTMLLCSTATATTPPVQQRDRQAQARGTERTVAAEKTATEPAVVLLDGGVPIDENKLVATLGTVLRSGGFRPEVVAEVQSRYFGYMLDRRQHDGRWEFVGPLQAFTAYYGSSRTTGWPDRTPFLYQDSRASAAAVEAVLPEGHVAEAANLRIYYRPDRVGFENGNYVTQDVLVMVYLDPETGHQSVYLYRPEKGGFDLYRYAPARIPSQPGDASIVSTMGVATTDTIRIQVFIASVSVPVPRNTYSEGLYRVFGGRNYEGTATPLGPPIRFNGLSQQQGMAPFAAALKAHKEGRPLTDKEFADVHRFIRHIHRYLVEKPKPAE